MPIPKLNFSTGNVVDPTKGALQGVTAARNTLTNSMNQWAKEEELARQAARQKVQDDRATTTYNQQQQELTDRQKFGQAMLGDRQMQYADANAPGSEIMSRMKNVELTPEEAALSNQGIETPAVAAKLKAQMELGQQFDSTGVRETEWDKLQRVARETGTGGSLGVQEKLYSAKAADAAARKAEETKAVAAKQKLVDEYNTKSDKLTDLLPTKRGHYGSTTTGSTGKSGSSKDLWAAEDAIRLNDLADSTSVFGYFGDTEDANKPITYAKSIGLNPKQTESVLVKMSVGPEGLWKDEKLRIPGKPEATDSEIQEYAREQMDTLAKSTTKSSGASGGFYNKEDNSSAIVKVKAEMKSLEKKINNFGSTDYSDDRSAGAKSMDKMNALAKKLWSELPAAGEEPKKGSAKTTNTNLISGKIGTAMSLKAGDGAIAKFASNPETAVEFAREYEELKPAQQARVDKVLQSKASQKVYDAIEINNSKPSENVTYKPADSKVLKSAGYDPEKVTQSADGKYYVNRYGRNVEITDDVTAEADKLNLQSKASTERASQKAVNRDLVKKGNIDKLSIGQLKEMMNWEIQNNHVKTPTMARLEKALKDRDYEVRMYENAMRGQAVSNRINNR